jgi:hypothetical protein
MTITHTPQFFTISDIINNRYCKLRFSHQYTEEEAKAIFAEAYNLETVEEDEKINRVNKPINLTSTPLTNH